MTGASAASAHARLMERAKFKALARAAGTQSRRQPLKTVGHKSNRGGACCRSFHCDLAQNRCVKG
jgi:hypothetical protein